MRRLFAAIVLVCCSAAWAQETVVVPMIDAESFKFALTKARREVFEAGMALTGPDKDAFWNVYTEFEKEKSALDNRRVTVMKEYVQKKDQLTNEQALKLVNDAA